MHPATSVLWALVPLLTIGFGTFAVLGFAAARLRSWWLVVCSVLSVLIMIAASIPLDDTWSAAVGGAMVLGPIGGGLTITFGVRSKLTRPTRAARLAAAARPGIGPAGVDPAIQEVLARRARRAEARRILETDPALARELYIGRPDLPRQYDDGGILDVNHVPEHTLAELPGFTPELAARVVTARAECGGFTLLSELVVYGGVPEGLADDLSDRLVFLE
jgi:hypothetical protein